MEESGWLTRSNERTVWFYPPGLEATGMVISGFSTRIGGVSGGPYSSLNQGLHVGDVTELVLKNRGILAEAAGLPPGSQVVPAQVHGDRVHLAEWSDAGAGARDLESSISDCDALITREPGLPLVTHHADCVALLILDPLKKAVGIAHAGWKGTRLRIGEKTVRAMGEAFGTRPEDCRVAISPSIGPCCYEVDAPLIEQFTAAFPYHSELLTPRPGQKAHLDLWEANRRPLIEIGVRDQNVFTSRLCTCCSPDYFYSYRREPGGVTGRMAAFIMLRPG
ncbi:MAG: peptidoglycan editing factor PgeF [Firmicutes bacterium]|nr:peptidoglycan editing factor PgeF [Bacillota bacterium]